MMHPSRLYPIALAVLAAGLAHGAAQEASKSALESDPAGWKEIMPGPNLAGWTRLPIPPTGQLGRQQWHLDAEAKTLVCDGDGGHDWLRYDRELGDGIFHVEWRFTPVEGKRGYNSGVFARNSADGAIWHQAQVGSSSGSYLFGETLVNGQKQRFNLSNMLKERRVKPAGEWNTYEITCKGPRLSVWVNGAAVSELPNCEVLRGYVGLEGEGYRIEFRNVKLKEGSP
jgi:hypothetical protein